MFGPSLDALIREIDARIAAPDRQAFADLIQTWRFGEDGQPSDPDALYHQLLEWRARPAAKASILGLLLRAAIGLPMGLLIYMVVRETVLPTELWSSDGIMWGIIAAVTLACAALGALPGGRAGKALLGFLLGAVLAGFGGGVIALTLGEVLGVSQREGAFAMGVVFTIVPLCALVGGTALGLWMGRRLTA